MKIAVVYGSLTGNTERLARGVFDRISPEYEKALFDIKDKPDLKDYDVIAFGFWVDRSFPYKAMKDLISETRDKDVFLMGTMGYYPDSDHGQACIKNSVSLVDKSCNLMGYFICNGKVDTKLLERMAQIKPCVKKYLKSICLMKKTLSGIKSLVSMLMKLILNSAQPGSMKELP